MNRYVIALGSNQRHRKSGRPAAILHAALSEMESRGLAIERSSAIIRSRPLGPSQREYANGAAVIATELSPRALLAMLQDVEAAFGRKRQGRRWRSRTLDLDIVLWSGGSWTDSTLVVPHREFRRRSFVLGPAAAVVPGWRDPVSGLSLKHLHARLTSRARPPS